MPTVHYTKRKVLKQYGIECVNGKFELENKTGKKSKRETVKIPWSMGRKRGAGNQNDHGRHRKPMEINCLNVKEQFDASNENDHGRKRKPLEINCRNLEGQFDASNDHGTKLKQLEIKRWKVAEQF